MALLPVEEALARILEGAGPIEAEEIALADAGGRVLAADLAAGRDQPPFPASAMDGYAVRAADIASPPARLRLVGRSAAGRRFAGKVGPGEAVRIFTGAPVPHGADTILLQEDASALEDGSVEAREAAPEGLHIRRQGLDFRSGRTLLEAGRVLDPAALSLAAAANRPQVSVVGRPLVAVLATGDELVAPGSEAGPDQIVSSNSLGVAEIVRGAGGQALDLGIAGDNEGELADAVARARQAGARILVTIGGASVGEHDLVRRVLVDQGMALDFWKIAMRPGKPLMFGRLGAMRALGLPGNPVSALVCSHLFLAPLVARLAGRAYLRHARRAELTLAMPAGGERTDYVRASVVEEDGRLLATPFELQDSSMLSTLAAANALLIRPIGAPPARPGESVEVLMLR